MVMSDEVASSIKVLFEDFDRMVEELEKIPESAKKKTESILETLLKGPEIFEGKKKTEFLKGLNGLSEEIGYAYHTVLAIELARQQVTVQKPSDLTKALANPAPSGQPITIQTSAPQLGWLSGVWYYKGEKEKAQALKELSRRGVGEPQISTSKEVIDILEFGRQLIPEFNRVQTYFRQSVDHLYFFDDDSTKERFHSEICQHMNKLAGIIRAFCRTITEYRKEVVGMHKREIGKAIVMLKMAEFQAMGEFSRADIFAGLRQAMGPQDAGR
jgi:hypothetical protein